MRIKDEKKYKSILKASMNQFRKEGFAKASISKIAKEADVSPGTIYIYFDHKEDLIKKLYLKLRKEMSDIVLGDIQFEGCFESAYKKMWLNYYHYCLNHDEAFDYIMQYTHSPFGKTSSSKFDTCYFNQIYDLFKRGKAQGVLKDISDEILFAYTFYPASQLAKRHLCSGRRLNKEQVEQACSLAWDAVSLRESKVACKALRESLNERLVDMFRRGEKEVQLLGVEFEHFLIDGKTLRSYDYFEAHGQLEIAKTLVTLGWQITYQENGYIFNLDKNKNTISFEPGGQFEISIRPCKTIKEVDEIYRCVMAEIKSIMLPSQLLVGLGYHPKSKIEDLKMLPKERYSYMYKYLHEKGPMARNMMKGTAATQVSIDYEDEEDFKKKYRVANFLAPFIARMFDASPVFEGEIYTEKNLRIKIWEQTDALRSKLPKGAMDSIFDYKAYGKYVENTQPLIMISKDQIQYTENKTLKDISKTYYLSEEELVHGMSMVFPDVRLKHFLELRMADALPYPHNMAVPALIKGIFYNKLTLDKYYVESLKYKDQDMKNLNEQLKQHDDFKFPCFEREGDCLSFIEGLFVDAIENLGGDAGYLQDYFDWYQINNNVASCLKEAYDTPKFLEVLKGGL